MRRLHVDLYQKKMLGNRMICNMTWNNPKATRREVTECM